MTKFSEKKNGFFWLSFSDIMTSLFFVMLVLFVLVIAMQGKRIEGYERLQKLNRHMDKLRSNPSFVYLPGCKKFVIKDLIGAEIFNPNETIIKQEYVGKALHAGREIEKFLSELNRDNELNFMLVIEGNMANFWDKRIDPDCEIV